ncbi:MAG: hypothetical protein KJO07_19210 [Deltaproteobacteria bacterium]|nr:hypothetical protein [Deltaproteobacteria bacterium]
MSRLVRTLLVLSVAFAISSLAEAQKRRRPPKAFKDKYFRAQTAYRLGELDKAEKLFREAGKLYRAAGVYRGLAAVYIDMGDAGDSDAVRNAAYQKCVDSSFVALKLSPRSSKAKETKQLHSECREKLGRPRFRGKMGPKQGGVAVITDTVGAQVKINGIIAGGTPIKPRPVNAGRAIVTVKKPKKPAQSFSVDIVAGVVSDVLVDRRPKSKKKRKRPKG